MLRFARRRFLALAGLFVAFSTMAAASASAQEIAGAIRIGLILPDVTGLDPNDLHAVVAHHAAQGAISATEDYEILAEMLGFDLVVVTQNASGPDGVVAAANRLVDEEEVYGIIGGYSFEEARALGEWSAQRGIPFLNVGASQDSLRNELCEATMFHVEPSAAMYIDALAGWYVRAGFRSWYIIEADTADGRALHERMTWSLTNRHFGAREVGTTRLAPGAGASADLVNQIRRSNADLVVMLLGTEDQIRVLGELDAAGLEVEVAGFPNPDAQTRAFYVAARAAAPRLGTQARAAAWEATIDAYGAREYNAFYPNRWNGEPNEPPAWATYHAVRILFEAAFFGGSTNPADVIAYMLSPTSVFDLHKGIAVSFRPWDHQIRQSLFLVTISPEDQNLQTMALLVGELPAIYMAGTDPVERLDQLGDLADRSRCRL